MPDVRELLQRKLDEAVAPEVTFDGFLRRRQRTVRRQRWAAGVVAIVVAVASLGVILRSIDRSTSVPSASPTTATHVVALLPPGSIAFDSYKKADDSIYLADPTGGTVARLVDLRCSRDASGLRCPGRVSGVSFSPDGTRLAYSLQVPRSLRYTPPAIDDGLYVLDLRTGASTLILACVRPECLGISGVAWSPDGASIAYAGSEAGATNLHLIAPDGSGDRHLYIGTLDAGSPAWSPDGSRIVFEADPQRLFTVSADGTSVADSHLEPLNVGGVDMAWRPSWSPDGRSIAFIGSTAVDGASSRTSVWVTDLEGHAMKIRALGVGENRAPSWSPDGSRIAVASEGKLVTIRPDGTGREELAESWSWVAPAWYPVT